MAIARRRIDEVLELIEEEGISALDSIAENSSSVNERDPYEEARIGWSIVAGKMVKAYKTGGFNSIIVYGKQGAGKSVYAIKVAFDMLRRLDLLPKKATTRDVYKRYMVFSSQQFISRLRRARDDRIPVLIWDDAGVHGGSYIFFTDVFLAKALGDLFRVARTRVSNIIFTTPSPRDLLKPFRSYDTIIVYVHEVDEVWSRAHIYQMKLLPSGDSRIVKIAIEDFKRRLRTYDDYLKLRDKYVDYAIEQLETLLTAKTMERMLKQAKLMEKAKQVEVSLDEIKVLVLGEDGFEEV